MQSELFMAGDLANVTNDAGDIQTPKPVRLLAVLKQPNGERHWQTEGAQTETPEQHLRHANELLDGALRCALRGWPVHPLIHKTKKPHLKEWQNKATTDTEQIRVWWRLYPYANVGVACGYPGPFVVDIDAPKTNNPNANGLETWRDLCQEHGIDDNQVWVSLTGGGGRQLFYDANGLELHNTAGRLGVGIDTRGIGGFVVIPPSVHPNGKPYVWEASSHPDDSTPCPLPSVLLALLTDHRPKRQTRTLPERIPEGERNATLTSLAGSIRRPGISEQAILAALEVENLKLCDPPLPQAELETIAASVARYEPEEVSAPLPQVSIKAKKVSIKTVKSAFNRGETGAAELLAKLFGGSIAYDHSRKQWYKWDTHRWVEDRTLLVRRLVSGPVAAQYYRVAGAILEQLTTEIDGAQEKAIRDKAKEYSKGANSLRYKNKISNVLAEATAVPTLALTGDEWDKDPWLLGVGNGVVDLRTGELRDGKPKDYIRTYTETDWQQDADAPRWDTFLQEIFAGDTDLVNFMQRLLGYGITGQQHEHKLPILWGGGRNGKDTLLKAIKDTLGAHARAVSAKIMIASRRDASPGSATPYLCALQGLRLCWAGETKEDAWLNAAQVKSMTGGGDQAGRPLYGNPITFTPSHLLMLMTNPKPRVNADDFALWQRLLLIPFTQEFVTNPETGQHLADMNLPEKLKKETSGILRWLVRGCLLWQAQGLNPPKVVLAATEEYRSEEDVFGTFLSECCHLALGVEERSGVLFKEYKSWTKDNELESISITAFGRRMGKKFKKKAKKNGQWYQGVALATTQLPN